MSAFALAVTSFVFMLAFFVAWQLMIRSVKMTTGRSRLYALVFVSCVAAFAALAKGTDTGGTVMAVASLLVCGMFLLLTSLAAQSTQAPTVAVGKPIPEFTAQNENDEIFDLASLRGRPVMLKFFRGHW